MTGTDSGCAGPGSACATVGAATVAAPAAGPLRGQGASPTTALPAQSCPRGGPDQARAPAAQQKAAVWEPGLGERYEVAVRPRAGKQSPYSGGEFRLEYRENLPDPSRSQWRFKSSIYHPLFRENQPLCHCMVRSACSTNSTGPAEGVIGLVSRLLESPAVWPLCPDCRPNPEAYADLATDPGFFGRKARLLTPGTLPLDPSDLKRDVSASESDFMLRLLKSGVMSDVRLVVQSDERCSKRRTVFPCHRTVLAARSPMFAALFNSGRCGNEIHTRCPDPTTFARFLKYIYTGAMPTQRLSPKQYLCLGSIAHACKVERLRAFAETMFRAALRIDNVADLLLVNQLTMTEPALTRLMLEYLATNLIAVAHSPGWRSLTQLTPGNAGKILRQLDAVVKRAGAKKQIRDANSVAGKTRSVRRVRPAMGVQGAHSAVSMA